ncbi:MAG: hypothetical protein HKP41_23735 [Desulfobacterales bacterium]|nr:hypothetical protein [Desulfobacterales bacterium]
MNKPHDIERRLDRDRRHNHIPFFKLIFYKGKRQTLRRSDDRKRLIVLDQYRPFLLISILVVLGLSLLDAFFTLLLLEQGAVEVNPVMQYYLTFGYQAFVISKYAHTAVALVIIVLIDAIISSRYRFGSLMLPFCGFVFGSVVIWELYLLAG